jgi:hypothetical protein
LQRAIFTSERSPLPALAAILARNGKLGDAWQRFEESLARPSADRPGCTRTSLPIAAIGCKSVRSILL